VIESPVTGLRREIAECISRIISQTCDEPTQMQLWFLPFGVGMLGQIVNRFGSMKIV
jgi:hypothetical protein